METVGSVNMSCVMNFNGQADDSKFDAFFFKMPNIRSQDSKTCKSIGDVHIYFDAQSVHNMFV